MACGPDDTAAHQRHTQHQGEPMADITIIGGINIDIEGKPFETLRHEDSNPGHILFSHGGVGRNITENIARMGGNVAMVSVIGDDHMGRGAIEELADLGVDISGIKVCRDHGSAIYLSILNEKNDMEVGICDMDIVNVITPEFLDERIELLASSKAVALDGNLNEDTLSYAADKLQGVSLFFDPVSSPKAIRAKNIIGKFSCIKPNIMEAEVLSGIEIQNEADVEKAGRWFISQGVEKVFITLNKDGVYYTDGIKSGFIRPGEVKLNSATGAGDSFSAAILLGMVQDMDVEKIAKFGMAAAQITMESSQAVNKYICKEEVERRIANV